MKDKWYIPVLLFVILVVSYIVRGFFVTRIELEMLQTDRIEEYTKAVGVLMKDEHPGSVPVTGITEVLVQDGERVANGEVIATVYEGKADAATKNKLADINKKISAMEDSRMGEAVFINDATKIETEIAACVDEVIAKASMGNFEALSQYKYKLSIMADQKVVAKGEKEGFSNDLVQLRAEKSMIESKLGRIDKAVMAGSPGIFIEGHDGFEKDLTMESALSMTPDRVNEIISKEKKDDLVVTDGSVYRYKIVQNYNYCVAMNIAPEYLKNLEIGDSIEIRFSDFSAENVPATIKHISSPDKKGDCAVVVEVFRHIEGLLERRVVNVDFVRKSVEGYKVSIEHLHTVDNAVGLYVKRGAVMKFIPVNVIYSTETEAIVASAGNESPIKAYDEVVTKAPVYENGRVIVSQ